MLCDETIVHLIAGKGGNGCIHFRREKYVPRGGPDGGDGGKGGNILLKADENCRTLISLHRKRFIKGFDGENGEKNNRKGADGENLTLIVPVGTIVSTENKKKILADFIKHDQLFVIAKGGKGGYGNTHYKSSRYQAPHFAELGEPGEETTIILELKLIADVGIIGLPSAGKSTLLNAVTRTQIKTAPYPFTTLNPNLGVVDLSQKVKEIGASFVMADIPGLIEGAHQGKGLGHQFLRHIVRTKILIHLIDATCEDPQRGKKIIEEELKQYDRKLKQKAQIIVFNKIDLLNGEEQKLFQKKWKKAFFISSITKEGLDDLLKETWRLLKEQVGREQNTQRKEQNRDKEGYKIFRPYEESEKSFSIRRFKSTPKIRYYQVTGKRIEQVAVMTRINQPEGLLHLRHYIKKLGIQRALIREGAKQGDKIFIRNQEIDFKII